MVCKKNVYKFARSFTAFLLRTYFSESERFFNIIFGGNIDIFLKTFKVFVLDMWLGMLEQSNESSYKFILYRKISLLNFFKQKNNCVCFFIIFNIYCHRKKDKCYIQIFYHFHERFKKLHVTNHDIRCMKNNIFSFESL